MGEYREQKEIQEAITAGERALLSLKEAKQALSSAGNWGLFDMLGGGMIATFAKHSKIDKARTEIEDAKRDIKVFERELRDVQQSIDVDLNIGDFLTFADYFFDGLIADWMVQSKINKAREQVDAAIRKVEMVIVRLRQL
ncbi:MAG: hypothetical protein Q4D90_11705 [bacterium]|nr:hypothetical protein [bacterium]